MANLPPLDRHPLDNAVQINRHLGGKSVLANVVGVHLDLGPAVAPYTHAMLIPYLYLASRGESYLKGPGNRNDMAIVIAVANTMAPRAHITALNQVDARARFVREVIALLCNEVNGGGLYMDVPPADYVTAVAAAGALAAHNAALPPTLQGFAVGNEDAIRGRAGFNHDVANALLNWVLRYGTPALRSMSSRMYIAAWVSFSKRGSITDNKADNINAAMVAEGFQDPRLTPGLVHLMYSQLGGCIDENNAARIFAAWTTDLGASSLRLRLAMEQAARSGLTALLVIKKAMTIFERAIDWSLVCAWLPDEAAAINAAFVTVNNNPYYGFAADLGNAKSTKFKSFAYFCKEMLLRHGGPEYSSLNNYGGWTRVPKFKNELDTIVLNYTPTAPVPNAPAAVAAVTALQATFTAANLLNM